MFFSSLYFGMRTRSLVRKYDFMEAYNKFRVLILAVFYFIFMKRLSVSASLVSLRQGSSLKDLSCYYEIHR